MWILHWALLNIQYNKHHLSLSADNDTGQINFFLHRISEEKKNIKQVTILIRTHKYVKGDNLPTTAPSAHQNPSELWHGVSSESLCILDYQEAGTL